LCKRGFRRACSAVGGSGSSGHQEQKYLVAIQEEGGRGRNVRCVSRGAGWHKTKGVCETKHPKQKEDGAQERGKRVTSEYGHKKHPALKEFEPRTETRSGAWQQRGPCSQRDHTRGEKKDLVSFKKGAVVARVWTGSGKRGEAL